MRAFAKRHLLIFAACAVGGFLIVVVTYLLIENRSRGDELARLESQVAALMSAAEQEEASRESITDAVRTASPAVVSIVVSKDIPLLEVEYVNPFGNDPFFRDIGYRVPVYRYAGSEERRIGAGTGFFVSTDGHIVTNRHVVADPDAEYVALLQDGSRAVAEVIYRDEAHDLAILKIAGTGYPALELADSSKLLLGQTVLAIGNALGEYNNSVSVGIISGLDRTIEAMNRFGEIESLSSVIQTDAAINRGNSGGPLLDLNGNVVGVNVAVEAGANNIAFAIPANELVPIIDRIIR